MLLIHESTKQPKIMYIVHTTAGIQQTTEAPTRALFNAFPRQAFKTQEDLIERLGVLLSLSELASYAQEKKLPLSLSTALLGYEAGVVSLRISPEETDWGYLAPEHTSQEKAERDARSDSFSLGCIFYELLSGKSNVEVRAALHQGSLRSLRQLSLNVPAIFDGLILRLLSSERERRPLPSEVKLVLSACIAGLKQAESATIHSEELATVHVEEELATIGDINAFEQTVLPEGLPSAAPHVSQDVPSAHTSPTGKSAPLSGSGSAGKAVPLPSGATPAHVKEPRSNKPEHKLLSTVERSNYEMNGELARGGLGKITVAKDTRLDRQVAIKELLRDRGIARARFLREALLTARLQHPGIVPIYEAGVWPSGEPFYTMKLIAGRPFDKVIKEAKTLEDRLAYLPQVLDACQAMAFAHTQKIIHRDLKPHNMIVGDFGETVVIDWGLAKDLAANDEPEIDNEPYRAAAAEHHDLTQTGEVMGTPAYMPIEQARGQRVEESADVYALGGILYHLLTGQPPYTGKKSLQVIKELLDRPPAPIEDKEPNVPKELIAIVNKAMAREAKDRYPTAKELANDLQKYQTGQLVGVYQYSPIDQLKRWARKNKGTLTASLVAASLLAVFGVYSFVRISNEKRAATEQRHIAIEAAADMEKERDKAQRKEAEVNKLYKTELLQIASERLNTDPQEAISKLQEAIDVPGETDWSLVRMIAMSALSNGIAHGPAGATAAIPVLPSAANRVAVSSGGTQIAVARADGVVSFFTLGSAETSEQKLHEGAVYALAFSPSGKYLATAGADHKILLHNLADKSSKTLLTLSDVATSVAFKDEDTIAVSGYSGEILLHNYATNTTKTFNFGHKVHSISVSNDQKWLAVSGDWHSLVIDLETGKEHELENFAGNDKIIASATIAFSPNNQTVAVVDSHTTGFVNLFSLTKEEWILQRKIKIDDNILWSARFSPDGARLAVSGAEGSVYLVEFEESRVLRMRGHKSEVKDVLFSDRAIVSVGLDRTVRVWDINPIAGETIFSNGSKLSTLTLSSDGAVAFFGAEDGSIFRFEMKSRASTKIGSQGGIVRSLSLSADQTKLTSSGVGTSITLWDLKTSTAEKIEAPLGDYISAISEDGKWIAYNNYEDPKISIFNTNTKEKTEITLHKKPIYRILFHDGKLHTCSADEKAFAVDLNTNEVKNLQINTKCQYIDLSTSGTTALTDYSPTVKLLAAGTNQELASLKGETIFNTLKISTSGEHVSALDTKGNLYLWSTSQPKLPLIKSIMYLSDAPFAFLPQGGANLLMTTGSDIRLFADTLPQDSSSLAGWLHTLPALPILE